MIKIYDNPAREDWKPILERPLPKDENLQAAVQTIVDRVAQQGDSALFALTQQYDQVVLENLTVSKAEIDAAVLVLPSDLKDAILLAKRNIEEFHAQQLMVEQPVEPMPGVRCWRESRAIERVGLYVPGGSAPLFSTVLMLAVPAKIAGCKYISLCTPPQSDGAIHPAILFAASITGVSKIFKIGGAQAIAAMTVGTETIAKVDKIFGPGNHFVTEAKLLALRKGVSIDLPAGPSEVLIIGDQTANGQFVAADMISQAEHGVDSQVMLVTNHRPLISETVAALKAQLASLPRKQIAEAALENSGIVYFHKMSDCLIFSNHYAPEHLILSTEHPNTQIKEVTNAGSVFLGHYSPESVGDYASGTNHTLPTAGWARAYSGVSVDSFVKKITFQQLTKEGLSRLGPAVEIMAAAEQLEGHRNAVSIRLNADE